MPWPSTVCSQSGRGSAVSRRTAQLPLEELRPDELNSRASRPLEEAQAELDLIGRRMATQFAQTHEQPDVYGKTLVGVKRTTFLIGPDGRVVHVAAEEVEFAGTFGREGV